MEQVAMFPTKDVQYDEKRRLVLDATEGEVDLYRSGATMSGSLTSVHISNNYVILTLTFDGHGTSERTMVLRWKDERELAQIFAWAKEYNFHWDKWQELETSLPPCLTPAQEVACKDMGIM